MSTYLNQVNIVVLLSLIGAIFICWRIYRLPIAGEQVKNPRFENDHSWSPPLDYPADQVTAAIHMLAAFILATKGVRALEAAILRAEALALLEELACDGKVLGHGASVHSIMHVPTKYPWCAAYEALETLKPKEGARREKHTVQTKK